MIGSFEISKATSGNAELVLEKLDMVAFAATLGDMEDRISSSGRIIQVFPEEPLYISGDGSGYIVFIRI
ncbi:MAG: hypothetical protein ACLTSO_09795 [Coprococcus sp.]